MTLLANGVINDWRDALDMTVRQIRLFHNAAIERECKQSANRIRDINAGMSGEKAQELIDGLLNVRGD